jgi:hypothetical protein
MESSMSITPYILFKALKLLPPPPKLLEGLFGKWRNQVDEKGLKGILENFDL